VGEKGGGKGAAGGTSRASPWQSTTYVIMLSVEGIATQTPSLATYRSRHLFSKRGLHLGPLTVKKRKAETIPTRNKSVLNIFKRGTTAGKKKSVGRRKNVYPSLVSCCKKGKKSGNRTKQKHHPSFNSTVRSAKRWRWAR